MTTTLVEPDVAAGRVGGAAVAVAAPVRKRRRAWRVPVILLVVVAGAVTGLWALSGTSGRSQVAGDVYVVQRRSFPVLLREKGELRAAKSIDVKAEVEGRSTIIWLIEEGSQVKQGDLLVKLASDEIDERVRGETIAEARASSSAAAAEKEHEILLDQNTSDLSKARLALTLAELELKKYEQGDWETTQLDMRLELERAETVLKRATTELEASEELYDKEYITLGDLYRDQLAKLEAAIAVEKAKINKETTEAFTYPKELTQRQSDVEEARKELERVRKSNEAKEAKSLAARDAARAESQLTKERLAKYKDQQAKCELKAPQDGLAVYETGEGRWDRRQISEGSEVYERQTIIKLPDTSAMMVVVRIHESKTDKIAPGQSATVEVEGVPGRLFNGKVTKIAPLADSQNMWLNPDLKEYETEITLDPNDAPLKPGVTARADIVVTELKDVIAVPVQSVFTKAGHHFVFRREGGDPRPVEVEIGISSDQYAEVTKNLAEGDKVLLAASEALRQTLPELEPRVAKANGGPPPPRPPQMSGERQRTGPGKGPGGGGQRGPGRRGP